MKTILPLIFSILALTISGCYAMGCYFMNSDSPSFPLGVLSTLVTLLVGWQIWQSIDIKTKVDSVDKKIKETIDDYDHQISGALYHIYSISYIMQQKYDKASETLMQGITEQMKTSNPVYLKNILKLFDEYIDYFTLNETNLNNFIKILNNLECNEYNTTKLKNNILRKLNKK